MPVVYVDVLFLVNFFANYIILFLTSKLAKIKPSYTRLFYGASVGALYAVCMFFPSLSPLYSIVSKFLFSLGLVAISFKIKDVILFFKVLGVFYFVSFALGGGAFFLLFFTGSGAKLGAFISNGILYINVPLYLLILSSFFVLILILVLSRFFKTIFRSENLLKDLRIQVLGEIVDIKAFIDTGNTLHDPITDSPVAVVCYEKIKPYIPEESREVFESSDGISKILGTHRLNFRFIPFSSLGKESGMLIGFKPDCAWIVDDDKEKVIENLIVGVYNRPLSKDDKYHAIIGPEILA
ncbi:MAG: sigma-E processing peptidase SpoIIGA [Clostridiaceae bacterium]|nr:sigma-E processing peptidase SpoIIGA [Clostridiaceae bacterium]